MMENGEWRIENDKGWGRMENDKGVWRIIRDNEERWDTSVEFRVSYINVWLTQPTHTKKICV